MAIAQALVSKNAVRGVHNASGVRIVGGGQRLAAARPHLSRAHGRRAAPCLAVSLDKEDKLMREAEARWESQVREGKVRNVSPAEAADLMKEGWILLDVRPPPEVKKASVKGAVEIPIFVPDNSFNVSSLLKQMAAFGMGGWWLGGTHMAPNPRFLQTVLSKVPKDAKIIVTCQKGLRSLAACEQLSRAGYTTLAWINGGLDTTKKGELPTKDDIDIRYAGIGGLSSVIGWTEVQQTDAKGFGSFKGVLIFAGFLLAIDVAFFAYEQLQYMQGTPSP